MKTLIVMCALFLFFQIDRAEAYKTPTKCSFSKMIKKECNPSKKETVDELGITEATMKCGNCLDYKIIGTCTWLTIQLFEISVKTSVIAKHYLPDYVVSIYSSLPAYETKFISIDGFVKSLGEAATGLESGTSDIRTYNMTRHNIAAGAQQRDIDTNLDYKKADIFVNPGIIVWNTLASGLGFSCASNERTPYAPKFISDYDPVWRGYITGGKLSLLEALYPQSLAGFPRQSQLPEFWGNIFPRTGWTSLPFDAMSALVAASRATDILTNNAFPHLLVPVGNSCPDKCWPPKGVELGNDHNKFQLVYPYVQDSAAPLPRSGEWVRDHELKLDLITAENGNIELPMEAKDHAWAWVLWRQYECCKKVGDHLITQFRW
jgi:integrating conjugative element protein (TIGR03756 family)